MKPRDKLIEELEGSAENPGQAFTARKLFKQAAQMLREDGGKIDLLNRLADGHRGGKHESQRECALLKTEIEQLRKADDNTLRALSSDHQKMKAQRDKLKAELEEAQRIAKMGVVERCRVVHWQVCHDCPDLDCGDNLTPAKTERNRYKEGLEKAAKALKELKDGIEKPKVFQDVDAEADGQLDYLFSIVDNAEVEARQTLTTKQEMDGGGCEGCGECLPSGGCFVCPECGPKVSADEDGCCSSCGADCDLSHKKDPQLPSEVIEGETSLKEGALPTSEAGEFSEVEQGRWQNEIYKQCEVIEGEE